MFKKYSMEFTTGPEMFSVIINMSNAVTHNYGFFDDFYGSEVLDDHTDIYPDKSMYGYLTLEVPIGWQKIELVTRQGTLVITADQAQPQ